MLNIRSRKAIEELVEEHCKKWERARPHFMEEDRKPVIAIDREAGSMGRMVAARLSRELGMDFYGSRIIHEVAKVAHMSERVIETLDEKGRSFAEDVFASFERKKHLVPEDYFRYLVKIIATIDRHGNGIILGRGAAHVLKYDNDLRVRFVAPLEMRAKSISKEFNLSYEEAERRVRMTDRERKAFVRQYFNTDYDDVRHYDMVINNRFMDVEDSVELIMAALKRKEKESPAWLEPARAIGN